MSLHVRRRTVLAALAALPAARMARADVPAPLASRVTLMVAGPAFGRLDTVSRALADGLRAHLPPGTQMTRTMVGGVDGVTGANQFTASAPLDGSTALLVPGSASLASLAGDSRVHFDPARWLPILARTSQGVVIGREGQAFAAGTTLRVAGSSATGPAMAAMLALDLLGIHVQPVFGLADDQAALAALQAGHVDAVLVRPQATLASLLAGRTDMRPRFSLPPADGQPGANDIAQLPTLDQFSAASGRTLPTGPRLAAFQGAAAAAQLQYALVLPSLTPAGAVALWREAGARAVAPDMSDAPDMLYAAAAAMLLRSLSPGGAALLDLRGWLADKLGWQPG